MVENALLLYAHFWHSRKYLHSRVEVFSFKYINLKHEIRVCLGRCLKGFEAEHQLEQNFLGFRFIITFQLQR
jgi:hypothetical protein